MNNNDQVELSIIIDKQEVDKLKKMEVKIQHIFETPVPDLLNVFLITNTNLISTITKIADKVFIESDEDDYEACNKS